MEISDLPDKHVKIMAAVKMFNKENNAAKGKISTKK